MILDQTYTLGIKPSQPAGDAGGTTLQLAGNGGALTLNQDLLAEMVRGTTSLSLSVNPLPELDAAGLVNDLDRYPYGCSEQTVSRAMPLLYLSDLGIDPDRLDGGIKERMEAAVARLVNRQSGNGAFGLWSAYGDDSNLWLSSYVTDFLLRAREKGFEVPEDVLVSGVDYLRNMVGNAPDIQAGSGQDMAYALYVLARAGRAPVGDLKYLTDTRINDFGSPLARAQMGAALAMLGDTARADVAFASANAALMTAVETTTNRGYRPDYGSVLRDASAILALATDSKAKPEIISTAMSAIEVERARTSYASTQDMSWMVLAARAIVREAENITLDDNGTAHRGALNKTFTASELEKDVRIVNTGKDAVRAVVSVTGSPDVAEPEAQNGLTISRDYYTTAGEPVDPSDGGAEHAAGRRAHGGSTGQREPQRQLPAGRCPSRRLRDREPHAHLVGQHGGPALALGPELRALHRVPRRPLRGLLQHLLRHHVLHGAGGGAGPLRASGRLRRGHVQAGGQCAHRHRKRDGEEPVR